MADVTLVGLDVADPPGRWEALGFAVSEAGCLRAGAVTVTLGIAPPGQGIVGWTLAGTAVAEGLGLPTRTVDRQPRPASLAGAVHPNGVVAIDHLVVTVPDLDAGAVCALGLRRRAEIRGRRMGFRRLGGPVLELVEDRAATMASFWGVTFAVADAAALDALSGSVVSVGEPRPAVQPGRRIATVSRDGGLSTRVAFIDSE